MRRSEQDRVQEIAERLRRYRGERGWTQAELSQRSGIARGTISRIELGREAPLGKTAQALASALGIESERLLGLLAQGALFPTPDELRMDLVRRIVELPDRDVERAHEECRRALDAARGTRGLGGPSDGSAAAPRGRSKKDNG